MSEPLNPRFGFSFPFPSDFGNPFFEQLWGKIRNSKESRRNEMVGKALQEEWLGIREITGDGKVGR
jgi:hypothetical protein